MPAAVLGGSLLGTQGGEPGRPRLRVKVRGSPSGLGTVEHVEPGPALLIRGGLQENQAPRTHRLNENLLPCRINSRRGSPPGDRWHPEVVAPVSCLSSGRLGF